MVKRKLVALGYPAAATFQADDENCFRNLVVWLEDQKIRHYPENERESLRNVVSEEWPRHLTKYLQDLGISSVDQWSLPEKADIIVSYAIRFEYSDGVAKYTAVTSEKVKADREQAPKIVAANPLDKLDFSSQEFIKGVNDLAGILKVYRHQDHLVTLEACARLIKARYSKEAIANQQHVENKGEAFPFEEVDKSFDGGDVVLNKAAKILRLLFITDLRDLQTKINECIVAVQGVTADPKTDTKLGKVGY